jgi:hypothetical protein
MTQSGVHKAPARVYPTDPKKVAAETLRLIRLNWERFDMHTWADLEEDAVVFPDGDYCGTSMCAAGWAVHAAGWVIKFIFSERGEWMVRTTDPESGEELSIPFAAAKILNLTYDQTFWFASEEAALNRLQAIADGHPVSNFESGRRDEQS